VNATSAFPTVGRERVDPEATVREYISRYISQSDSGEATMKTARIFTNGRSQAVRLPKECRLSGDEVYVKKLGSIVVLLPIDKPWASLAASLDHFSDDFLAEREQPPVQKRNLRR